eukprot:scaffold96273_cov28-Tisochrysis_lutea.AAC.2
MNGLMIRRESDREPLHAARGDFRLSGNYVEHAERPNIGVATLNTFERIFNGEVRVIGQVDGSRELVSNEHVAHMNR